MASQGLICYKPGDQDSCFLREMDQSDYDNVHSVLQESTHKVTGSDMSTRENVSLTLNSKVSLTVCRICETT